MKIKASISNVILIALVAFFLLFGLLRVLYGSLLVAPRKEEAVQGRIHYQFKNTTRFFGQTPQDIFRSVNRAVFLDEQPERIMLTTDNLPDFFQNSYQPTRDDFLIILAASGSDLAWNLPGLYLAYYRGYPVVFANQNELDIATETRLLALCRPGYVMVPEALVSDEVLAAINRLIPVKRVAHSGDLYNHAVQIARYYDEETGFGWGRTYEARYGYFEFVVTTPAEAGLALAALELARSNAATLLFLNDNGGIPGTVDAYIWQHRADWFVTPAEGPFRHIWILGNRISYAAQSRLDFALEKGDYPARGMVALGPLEGLLLVFIFLGFACGLFVLVHSLMVLPEVPLGVRLAWIFTALLAPVLGLLLYFAAYRRPKTDPAAPVPHFLRPPAVQAGAATAMSFGYGAPIMITIGFLFVYFGFPLFFAPRAFDWLFVFGAGMVLMMIVMWVGAILIAWPLAQYPIHREIMPNMPWKKLVQKTFIITALSMSAVTLGMMSVAWWMQMVRLPMMPHDDEILWFGAMWLASFIGYLIAWPLNYPMVRTSLKTGSV